MEDSIAPALRYEHVIAKLRYRTGVSVTAPRKSSLGPRALCVNGRIFTMLSKGNQLVVRLPRDRVKAMICAGRGAHFELSPGRPMQEWFVAGTGLEEEWLSLAEEALLFVAET